jgi:N-methylhydantoinase B
MNMNHDQGKHLDAVGLEIQWGRLIAIMNETDAVLVRGAFSSVVCEGHDFACVLVDAQGFAVAQSTSSTLFTITLPRTVRALIDVFPPETLVEGDVLLTNDPWLGAGHLPDFILVRPVFRKAHIVGYIAAAAHVADIGGRRGYFESHDIFEEGLQLPPCKIYQAGEPNHDIFRILESNVRVPDQVIGDLRAIIAAEYVGAKRLLEFMEDYDLADIETLAQEIYTRSEQAMRSTIRDIPDGEYCYYGMADGYSEATTIPVRIIIKGDELLIDFQGAASETFEAAINCPLHATLGDVLAAIKFTFAPNIPNNEGLFRPVEVVVPQKSILNCSHGAPVRGRAVTAFRTHEAIYGALSAVTPMMVQAGTGLSHVLIASGRLPSGKQLNAYLILKGGKGALYDRDGIACISFPVNGAVTPTEIFERRIPLIIEEKTLVENSGGPGKYRGGQGQRVTLVNQSSIPVTIAMRPLNVRCPPPGMLGGQSGPINYWELNGQRLSEHETTFEMSTGDRLSLYIPGGGGFFSALERTPTSVRADVIEGRVSLDRAATDYGVKLDPVTLEVLEPATRLLRQQLLLADKNGRTNASTKQEA